MLNPLKLPTKAWSPWKARSEVRNPKSPGLAGSKKPAGFGRLARWSTPSSAVPGFSKPAARLARGSSVVGNCACAGAAASNANTAATSKALPIPHPP